MMFKAVWRRLLSDQATVPVTDIQQVTYKFTKEVAFEVAYGREPDTSELQRIRMHAPVDEPSATDQLRAVVACFDRQSLGTPITVRFGERDLYPVDLDGFSLQTDRGDISVSNAIRNNPKYEAHLGSFIRRILRPGMVAADVGANIGYFTMLMAKSVGERGKILAFEPNSENCRLILLSAEANGFENIDLFPIALTEKSGFVLFTPALGSNGTLLDSSMKNIVDCRCVVVPSARFDSIYSDRIDFIKIDVEGAEYRALQGAASTIKKHLPVITSEFCPHMLWLTSNVKPVEYLESILTYGYRGYVLGRSGDSEEITDAGKFMAGYGSDERIEDLAFLPPGCTATP